MSSDTEQLLHEELIKNYVIRSCINCSNFIKLTERCTLAPTYGLPAKVVVFGCPKWDMDLPF
jgi:hypothetical protein